MHGFELSFVVNRNKFNPLPPEQIIFYAFFETLSWSYEASNQADFKKLVKHFVEKTLSYKFVKKLISYFHFLTKIFDSEYGFCTWVQNEPPGGKGLIILTSISYVYFWLYLSQNTSECKTKSIRKMNIAHGHKKRNNMHCEKESRQVWNQVRGKSKM